MKKIRVIFGTILFMPNDRCIVQKVYGFLDFDDLEEAHFYGEHFASENGWDYIIPSDCNYDIARECSNTIKIF